MSTVPQKGESQPLSPNKGGGKPTENGKLNSLRRKSSGAATNGRNSIRSSLKGGGSVSTPGEERPPLLGSHQQRRQNGSISSNQLILPSPNHIQIPNADGDYPHPPSQSGPNSRRCSGESSGESKSDHPHHNGMRRFTKGFIRFPSMRRPSTSRGSKSCKRSDRTTKMLVAVLILFLVTEFPQGIMHFLTGWYGPEFFRCYYNTWAEVWDMLALINSAVNFILYCFMSKQFRTQFRLSFNLGCFHKYKFMGVSACNNNQATVSTTV